MMRIAQLASTALVVLVTACGTGGGGFHPPANTDGGSGLHLDSGTGTDPDMTQSQPKPDLTMMTTSGTATCGGIITCLNDNKCADKTCFDMCNSSGTTKAQGLLKALLNCLSSACPATNPNDVCGSAGSQSACSACYMKAQMANGACYNQLQACGNDM